jgi:quinol monooxygenase YgiN
MYVIRTEAEVASARAAEFVAAMDELSEIHSSSAGAIGATVLQSYANPGRYTVIARWTDRASYVAASGREPVVAFGRSIANNVGLLRPLRMLEAYESVFEVDRADAGQGESSIAERLVDYSITVPMVAPAFEAALRQLAEVSTTHAPGVGSVRLRRSVGIDTKYLLIVIVTDHAAARGWLLSPQVRELVEQQTFSQYLAGSPQGEIHQVVKRYVHSQAPISQSVAAAASP